MMAQATVSVPSQPTDLAAAIDPLVDKVNSYLPTRDGAVIRRAFDVARRAHDGQKRKDGTAYISHPLATADILASLGLDPDTVAAGLLHDTIEDTPFTLDQLRTEFGPEIAQMVDGVTKLSRFEVRDLKDAQAESLRKMFLAMAENPRVVLIKLADRLHNMRTLDAQPPESQRRIAQETVDIYAPLANRLGIWQIKWELEDLCFRYLEPTKYREIRALLQSRRAEREAWIQEVMRILSSRLAEESIQAQISGRPKHIYSIYRKMRRKGVSIEQIYDLHAIRVLVNNVRDCYGTLGIVHSMWTPIPGEFDDYIATPKDNFYQSLHTAVVGPDGKPVEVQIRTHEMHQVAEYGIAAHWRYKEQGKPDQALDKKIAWLRQMLDWPKDAENAGDFVDALKSDVFREQVYVFTPKGKIVELAVGATPIDLAYSIHSDIGDRCRGALVNGRIVPLDYQLKTGEQVEILTSKQGGPSRDWLNPNLGYVRTARAREKIRQYFRRQERDENIRQGRELLEKELRRLGLDKESYDSIAKLFKHEKVEDFLAALGSGDINPAQIATKIGETAKGKEELSIPSVTKPRTALPKGASVDGIDSLLFRPARCCNPVPGEEVVGFITRGRGLTLHRSDCPVLARITDQDRLVHASWPADAQHSTQVAIRVIAMDRTGLVRDIADVVAKEGVNMASVQTQTSPKQKTAVVTAVLEVSGLSQLSRILHKVGRLPNVVEAQRV